MFLKFKILTPIFLFTLFLAGFLLAGNTSTTTPPEPTMYSIADIYALIDGTATTTKTLSPTTSSSTPSMYSISELYVKLANLIDQTKLASPSVTYLGVTGGTTPTPVDDITKEFTPTSDSNTVTGFTLEDIYDLITENTRPLTPGHSFAPESTPSSTMHSLNDIYTELSTLIDPANILSGQTYLGVEGEYEQTFSGGDGSSGDPYQIATCTQLQNAGSYLTSNFILVNDIDCSDTVNWNGGLGFEPVGGCADGNGCPANAPTAFTGILNGNSHVISDLYINRPEEHHVGLFGYVDGGMYSGGSFNIQISNIGLENVDIVGQDFTGGLIGQYAWTQYEPGISQVYTTGSISGRDHVGGIIGYLRDAGIKDSYSRADVSGDRYVGGLVGHFAWGTTQNTYATGNVSGNSSVGGLHGHSAAVNFGVYQWIRYSFATGYISGDESTSGGISGNIAIDGDYELLASRWYDQVDDASVCIGGGGAGSPNCLAVMDEDYFRGNVYPGSEPMAHWDFPGIWEEVEGDYPVLTWQGIGGSVE